MMEFCTIASHSFAFSSAKFSLFETMPQFVNFTSDGSVQNPMMNFRCDAEMKETPETEPIYSVDTTFLGSGKIFRDPEGSLLWKNVRPDGQILTMTLAKSGSQVNASCNFDSLNQSKEALRALNFALWLAYSYAGSEFNAIGIHSSAVVCDGAAILCLGESGTGKSTHTSLWLDNIPGTSLLNDDSPIVSIASDGVVNTWGSPWSGKTPCYRNESFPLKAILRIVRSPFNKITKLDAREAVAALFPSFPPELSQINDVQDRYFTIISSMVKTIPVYTLECLPDAQAALLAYNTVL